MLKGRHAVLLFVVPALLAGCGVLESKRIDYKSAGKLPPLEVPPDLTRAGRDDRYAVPDINPTGTATFSAYNAERGSRPRAGSTEVLPDVEKVRVQRAGSERWLVVDEAPEKVWPLVKQFWQENGFLLKVEMPEAGIMETDWAENRANIPQDVVRRTLGKVLDQLWSTGERDKFRTRLERTADGQGTEIFISHRGMVEEYQDGRGESGTTIWQPRPADPELEAEFLNRLMVRLGVANERAESMLASETTPPRATLGASDDGVAVLTLDEPFDRAWRRVGLALDRVGFTVEDRDRSNGLYYVRYVDPRADRGKEGGFLSKLAFWRSSAEPNKAVQYQVRVREGTEASQVQVLDENGQPEASDISHSILNLLLDQLK